MAESKTKALVLSGGGSRGAYECGAWQAMQELGMEFHMILGTSVGALNGVMFIQADPVDSANLWRSLETQMIFDVEADAKMHNFAWEFITGGGAGTSGLQKIIAGFIDEEKVRKSPVDLGIVTVEFPSRTPHYLWKDDIPEGRLSDYITASASAFPALKTFRIDGREYIDGGYADNMPIKMAVEHGATHVTAVFLDAFGQVHPDDFNLPEELTIIESHWDLGDFLVFDRRNTRKIMRLGYLDTMKTYGIFDGFWYSFAKGQWNRKNLRSADLTAKIFEMDPLVLYTRESFLTRLQEKILESADEVRRITEEPFELKPERIKGLMDTVNRKTLVLAIADRIRKKKDDRGPIRSLLKDEIRAAEFILENGLLPENGDK